MSKIAGELNAEMMHPKVIHEQRKALFAEMVGKTGSTQSVLDRLIQEIAELRQQLADRDEQISDLTISSDTYFAERNSARDVWRRASKDRDELRQKLAEAQKRAHMLRKAIQTWSNSTVREELIAAEKGLVLALFATRHNGAEMKFYTDLKGTIEAQPGDLIALAVSEYGGMLHQPEVSKRPRLSADGKSAMFDWTEWEGGPFMVTLEE